MGHYLKDKRDDVFVRELCGDADRLYDDLSTECPQSLEGLTRNGFQSIYVEGILGLLRGINSHD